MTPIDRLIQSDRESPKRIAVIGDAMLDMWVHGRLEPSQDGCMKFVEESRAWLAGGAANAAKQLDRWDSLACFVSPLLQFFPDEMSFSAKMAYRAPLCTTKTRHVCDGRIVFRHDAEVRCSGLGIGESEQARQEALKWLKHGIFDACLISDYDKGFLTPAFIRDIIAECQRQGIPCVADAKREPGLYRDAILKCNADWSRKYGSAKWWHDFNKSVTTGGPNPCTVIDRGYEQVLCGRDRPSVNCVSHVGAGDCFAAHLTLALAHGLPLEEAAAIAHSAGRVYVQHEHSRPPWPHETRRDLDPVGGKVIPNEQLAALRQSITGRVVFANGVFRIPHAGHAWLLDWAQRQGDVLVVGINDDLSSFRQKLEDYVLPLAERCAMLAGLAAVDWIVPYGDDTPVRVMEMLQPSVLVKGSEYAGKLVPSIDGCPVVIAPPSPFERHCDGLVAEIRGR